MLHNFTKSGAPWIVTMSISDFYENLEVPFSLICKVPSLMLFYNLMQSRVVVAQTYRIPSDSLFITTLSIIETYRWVWECACIAHLYLNWYDAFGFVTLSLMQCIYVFNCMVIICLDNRFMNARPPPPNIYPNKHSLFWWNYEKGSLKKTHIQMSCAKCQPFFSVTMC